MDIEIVEAALINTGLQPGATESTKNKPFQRFAIEKAVKTAQSQIQRAPDFTLDVPIEFTLNFFTADREHSLAVLDRE